ncbi:UNVERIFIED_CONTAM: hypothetical protein FKN15_013350 [Acipenser sinensis]
MSDFDSNPFADPDMSNPFQTQAGLTITINLVMTLQGRKNNWPPLPEKLPVGPCFYHDIAIDIPVEFQKTVKIMYYLWMCEYESF